MKQKTQLRHASMDDYERIEALYKKIMKDLDARTNYPVWHWGIHPDRDMILAGIECRQQYLWLYQGQLAGTALINRTLEEAGDAAFKGTHYAVIHLLGMDPALSGKGLADAFLEAILQEKKKEGYTSFRLSIVTGNWPAKNLYLRHGFETIGTSSIMEAGEPLCFELMEKIM